MPQSLGTLLGDDSIIAEAKQVETEEEKRAKRTFGEAVEELKLPRGEPPQKGQRKKEEISLKPHQMLETIDLSGFKYKVSSTTNIDRDLAARQ